MKKLRCFAVFWGIAVLALCLTGCHRAGSLDADPATAPGSGQSAGTSSSAPTAAPLPRPTPAPTPEPTPTPTPAPIEIDGASIPWDTEELDLSGRDLAGQGVNLYELLGALPELKKIDLCGTGYTNDDYAALQDAFPDVRIIWEIVLHHWTIRTDVVAFSTMKTCAQTFFLRDEDTKYFKYCTDLVALDIGHNRVTDISFLQYMPNLKILILVDNNNYSTLEGSLTDLSWLRYTPKLVYLEFFANHVSDISFLQYTPDLVDLNISYNDIRNDQAEYLYGLEHLERLWMEHTYMSYGTFQKLQAAYPNAQLVYYGEGSIDHGWRTHERYFAMRDMFNKNNVHPLFAD